MNENNPTKESKEEFNKGILAYDNDDQQTIFKLFGIELTAPKGLKRPRLVYISFIVINLLLLVFLKNLISH
ncbi:hypothetical protein [Prochlorococcus marinus]|uniref:hypothetical protein n=1 Tax=Prochlorococcus marinus TaxID=1219 RepID=UPI0022B3F009|nr:hypothetical protein [Prochlorococcus marinus]